MMAKDGQRDPFKNIPVPNLTRNSFLETRVLGTRLSGVGAGTEQRKKGCVGRKTETCTYI